MHADWFRTVFLHVQLDGNTELARVVDVIISGTSNEHLHFNDQSKQVDFRFCIVEL